MLISFVKNVLFSSTFVEGIGVEEGGRGFFFLGPEILGIQGS